MGVYQVEHSIDLTVSREEIWPYLAHTDALNRELGLPLPSFRYQPLETGGSRADGEIRLLGMKIRYREHPFEWERPSYYHVRRTFDSGPMKWAQLGSDLLATSTGCRIRSYCTFETTPSFRAALSLKMRQSLVAMDAVLRRFETDIQTQSKTAYRRQLEQNPVHPVRLRRGLELLSHRGFPTQAIERLSAFLSNEPDLRVSEFRACDLGNGETQPWLSLCLAAVQAGLLNLEWRVLCPYCRSNLAKATRLSGIREEAHCIACNIAFDASFDQNVEVLFGVHPNVRSAVAASYCIGGPELARHVAAQWVLSPGESRTIIAPPIAGTFQTRSLSLTQDGRLTVAQDGPSKIEIDLKMPPERRTIQTGGEVEVKNGNPFEVVWRWEDPTRLPHVTTAAEVTSLQEFRDQFASEVLSPGEQIAVNTVVVMFTDLKGSTRMYRDTGDALSYAQVRRHFDIIKQALTQHQGGTVKTIGDAVMAVFRSVDDAVDAAAQIHDQMAREMPQLITKIGLHCGPALVVEANGILDYFGQTVNQAARLQKFSLGGDLILLEQFLGQIKPEHWNIEPFQANVPDIGDNVRLARLSYNLDLPTS